jgi:hypothetical protein
MEPLVFAIIAVRKGYQQNENFVPEPTQFLPFDLRALNRSYQVEKNTFNRPSNRQGSFVTQVAS